MTTKHPTCSKLGIERSNPQGEARASELVSRNALRELDSASLHNIGVVNLSEMLKPATDSEEMFTCNYQTPRGDWRWRARKEKLRNPGDPLVASQPFEEVGQIHSSREAVNHRGAKGSDCRSATIKSYVTA